MRSTVYKALTIFTAFSIACCFNKAISAPTSDDQKKISTIKFTLPEKTLSLYALPVNSAPKNLKAKTSEAVKHLVSEPLQKKILSQYLPNPAMKIKLVSRQKLIPPPLKSLPFTSATAEQVSVTDKASRFIVVGVYGSPATWPPENDIVARSTAGALATELDTIAIDLYSETAMNPQVALEIHKKDSPLCFSNFLKVLVSTHEKGCWMTSEGLWRFGIPEIQAVNVPPQLDNEMSKLITGLAWKLLKECKSAESRTIDLPPTFTLLSSDITDAYGIDKVEGEASTVVHLQLQKSSDTRQSLLTITAPPGDERDKGEHFFELLKPIFDLTHHKIISVERSEEMEKAIVQARSKLPDIRKRFLSGELSANSKLIVKFAVKGHQHTEFLWAYVADWSNANVIKAYSGNDALHGSRIKAGQEIRLEQHSVVDWAVMNKGKIVEGAWTNKVLGH